MAGSTGNYSRNGKIPFAMRAIFSSKIWIVILSLMALGALTMLAIGLGSVSFRDGQAFGRNEAETVTNLPGDAIQNVLDAPWQSQLTVLSLTLIMFLLISLLLSAEARKRLLRFLLRFSLTVLALYILIKRYPNALAQFRFGQFQSLEAPLPEAGHAPVPVFTPPQSQSWLVYIISFGIGLFLVFVAWRVYRAWKELNGLDADSSKVRIAHIVRSSLNDLSAGRESTDVILNCYYRMSDVVSSARNIKRHDSMTPGEFASRLESAGLPSDSVRTLTRLFEAVRYGGHKSNPRMIDEAVTCLTSILQFCGEAV